MRQPSVRNQVQLITYPDSLGKNLTGLRHVLEQYVRDAIGGIHILPFYPSSADRGFAPLTHLSVDPQFGDWEDIRAISYMYDLMVDLTVNHLSCASPYFKDYLDKGDRSKYAELFLEVDSFLQRHGAELDALEDTYRPRPSLPYTEFRFADGVTRKLWTAFTNHQVDLDVTSDVTRNLMVRFIDRLVENGANIIRLDAVGYTVKKPWTSSFLLPETYEFMRWLRSVIPEHVAMLAEAHHDYERQASLLHSKVSDYVYDFSLPLLTLHALYTKNGNNLKHWITIRPPEQFTTLDTHDGIGVIDVKGLMTDDDVARTVEQLKRCGGNLLMRASGKKAANVDIYQMNTTYYSALGENDDAYIAARAIQFFIPGIPQVYYVGLLAGSNDFELFEKTNHGRDVNRHNYSLDEVEENLRRVVVQRLLHLMQFRSHHPAFGGTFSLCTSPVDSLHLRWDLDDLYAEARINLTTYQVEVEYVHPESGRVEIKQY